MFTWITGVEATPCPGYVCVRACLWVISGISSQTEKLAFKALGVLEAGRMWLNEERGR